MARSILSACEASRAMKREMTSRMTLSVTDPTELVLQIAVAKLPGLKVKDELVVTVDGKKLRPVEVEVEVAAGTRMHVVTAPVGHGVISYQATVKGQAERLPVTTAEASQYLRPSRFVESDVLADVAEREFGGLHDQRSLLEAVSSWVGTRLSYVPGSSGPTDGASDTLAAGRGVCRDYAHLTTALLRARGLPARLVAVYAPGCDPMDFHAVVEAVVDDVWQAVDATALAPRQTMVRIATGRDAADTAFLSNNGGSMTMDDLTVTAVVAGRLPKDDVRELVEIR
jgi:transglutaminase-like putative cysteine protease